MRRVRWALTMALLTAPLAGSIASQEPKPAPAPKPDAAPKPAAGPVLVVETAKGTIEIEMYPADAPKTVEQITALAKRNFYNGLRVHRVVPDFVVQFGDPLTRDMTKKALWGTGGSGRVIGAAETKRTHRLGSVAMAHAGDPAKADSQMYILLRSSATALDGKYAVFGQVITGMDVVQKIAVGDLITRVSVKP
jgi:cyclophilin family peptidyl-prolyl cis-trans isomerase